MRLRSPLPLAALCGALLPLWASAAPVVQVPGYQVELFASGVGSPAGMALSPGGDLYLSDYAGGQVLRINSPFANTGNPFDVVASGIQFPTDVAFAFGGRLFLSSSTGPTSQILEALGGGTTQVFASGFSFPTSLASFGGFLYVANSGDGTVSRIDGNGNVSGFVSGFSAPDGPVGLSFDSAGNLYLANHETGAVFVVDSGGNAQQVGTVSPFSSGATTPTAQGIFVNDVVVGALALIDNGVTSTFATGFAGKDNPPFNGPGEVVDLGGGVLLVADAQSVWRISTVPEPGTLMLLLGIALGAVALTLARNARTLSILALLFSAGPASAAPVLWVGNGNHYDFIAGTFTWSEANTTAQGSSFMGVPGHLVTITSAAENAFLNATFNTGRSSNFAWTGGREPNDDGVWLWVVGPEAGIQFSNFGTATAPFNYVNWDGIEPNDDKVNEDFLTFNIGETFQFIGPGGWADSAGVPSTPDPVIGYLVEYESQASVPEPATLTLLGVALAGLGFTRRRKLN